MQTNVADKFLLLLLQYWRDTIMLPHPLKEMELGNSIQMG